MNIFHIIDSGGVYGAEMMIMHLMQEQVKMGFSPVLISIGLPFEKDKALEVEARRRGLKVLAVRMRPGPNWIGAFAIIRLAVRHRADIFHCHGYKANILFGLLPRIMRRYPIVGTLHGWTSLGNLSKLMLYEWLEAVSFRFVEALVLVNENIKSCNRLKKIKNSKVSIIENGIPFDNDSLADTAKLKLVDGYLPNLFTFGAIGRLSPEKGFGLLLDAFADLISKGHEAQLVILGEGEERVSLETAIKQFGLENRVHLPGYVSEVNSYFSLFDAFLLPSFTEGLPMVLLEAMKAGVPVVASRVGGVPKVLGNGKGGLLFDTGDKGMLAQAMVAVLKDSESAQERTLWALRAVQETYNSRVMAEKYNQVYRKAMA